MTKKNNLKGPSEQGFLTAATGKIILKLSKNANFFCQSNQKKVNILK